MSTNLYHYNLGQYFSAVLEKHDAGSALCYADRVYRYHDLSLWIDGLASFLLAQGLRQGDVIAIGHTKRPLSYALMHAALRLGIAYVVIDVTSPVERISKIVNRAESSLLFYDDPVYLEKMETLAKECHCGLHLLEESALPTVSEEERGEQQRLMRQVDGSTIAYVMFTSGSTGMPKGVAVTHQNVLHFIAWGRECFGIGSEDNFANLSPMYFDNSVFDFYIGMFSGASLTPIGKDLLTNPYELVPYIEKMGCTIWFSVPSLLIYLMTMKAISAGKLSTLRAIVFGGEGYPKVELKKLYDLFREQASLVNVYGPTECTCICSAHFLGDADFEELSGLPTLGQLNPNFDFRILDDDGNDSDSGELCLIGPNVSAGYINDKERTAESFVTLIEPKRFMKRMYKTGDIVRRENGRFYFLGRKDNQIKHMGYRIELEEIEHALVKLSAVDQAAVIYQRTNTAYGKIIGFAACSSEVDEKALLNELTELLPDYMVPSKLVVMEKLPKNANGKVDRQSLRAVYEKTQ